MDVAPVDYMEKFEGTRAAWKRWSLHRSRFLFRQANMVLNGLLMHIIKMRMKGFSTSDGHFLWTSCLFTDAGRLSLFARGSYTQVF